MSIALKFRVELVWQDEKETASSIYLTGDGQVILQGRAISPQERAVLSLPPDGDDQRRSEPDPGDRRCCKRLVARALACRIFAQHSLTRRAMFLRN
jgi:hypothetical protein